jgi:hypothetical protein
MLRESRRGQVEPQAVGHACTETNDVSVDRRLVCTKYDDDEEIFYALQDD